MIERMKQRWGVGPWGMLAILAAFSLAGPSVVLAGRPLLRFLLPEQAPWWMTVLAYPVVMIPLYQAFLISYGALLGQFRFFWEKEKKLGRWLLRLMGLRRRSQNTQQPKDVVL